MSGTGSKVWMLPEAELQAFLDACAFARKLTPHGRALTAPMVSVPAALPTPKVAGRKVSTQSGFGDILAEIGRGQGELKDLAEHILTTSPDVTVSTNLGPWVNRRGIFDRHTRNDVFRDAKLASAQRWGMSPKGQHIELGIAEQNLFLLLGAAGLAPAMTGARVLPIGTVYDPFVNRGLDALIYALYQDARFLLVSTPSGLTLAPEGGTAPVGQHAADRYGGGPAGLLRTRPCGRTGGAAAACVRDDAAAGGIIRLVAPVHADDRATVAGGGCERRGGRRALGGAAARGGANRAGLSGAGGAGGLRRVRGIGGGRAWGGAAGDHVARPAACGVAGGNAGSPSGASAGLYRMWSAHWRRWQLAPRWSRYWTGTRRRMRGWGRCGGSGWCRSGRTGSDRAVIFRICIGSMGSTRTRSWMRVPRRCWRDQP